MGVGSMHLRRFSSRSGRRSCVNPYGITFMCVTGVPALQLNTVSRAICYFVDDTHYTIHCKSGPVPASFAAFAVMVAVNGPNFDPILRDQFLNSKPEEVIPILEHGLYEKDVHAFYKEFFLEKVNAIAQEVADGDVWQKAHTKEERNDIAWCCKAVPSAWLVPFFENIWKTDYQWRSYVLRILFNIHTTT